MSNNTIIGIPIILLLISLALKEYYLFGMSVFIIVWGILIMIYTNHIDKDTDKEENK